MSWTNFDRTRRTVTSMGALASLAAIGLAANVWKPEGSPPASGGTLTFDVSVGGIQGTGGAYIAFAVASSTSTFIESHGELGGMWGGSQFELEANSGNIPDEHAHHWIKEGGGVPSAQTLRAQTSTFDARTGWCGQLDEQDPQWWWRPTVNVTVNQPQIQKFNTGTGNWDDQNWTATFGDLGDAHYSATQPTGNEPTPAGPNYQQMHWRGTFSMPQSAAGTRYRAKLGMTTGCTASVDNAVVALWRQGIHVDLASSISNANPNDDFNLWP
jgi:hypothetical protein